MVTKECVNVLRTTVHLTLSAGRMVTSESLWSDVSTFLSCREMLDGGALALADTFSLSCSASVLDSLLFLIAVSVAVMRSNTGNCVVVIAMLRPFAKTFFHLSSFSGWVKVLAERFLTQFSVFFLCKGLFFLLHASSEVWGWCLD